MKRNELKPGMKVEIQRGTDYPTFTEAFVVDTAPWTDGRYTTFSRFNPRKTTGGSGVAVAVREFGFSSRNIWVPRVVQLRQLKPVGTEAAYREKRDQQYAQSQQAQVVRTTKLEQLRQRLGLKSHQLSWSRTGSTYSVELPTVELEKLLDELEDYRRNWPKPAEFKAALDRELRHTTPADEPHTVDS